MAKNVPFVLNGVECTGNEDSLLDCVDQTFGEVNNYRDEPYDEINMAGVRCERKLQQKSDIYSHVDENGYINRIQ